MALDRLSLQQSELSPEAFAELTHKLDEHVAYATSQNITTSISIQNGFHIESEFGDHEVVDLGEQEETFAAGHAKLALVAFKLVQGSVDKDVRHDLLSMLRLSSNGAFIRQKKHIAPEVVSFAKTELELDTDILTIRNDGTSFAGQTTARDSLKLFLKTVQLARNDKDIELSRGIHEALSANTSQYGVRARFKPKTDLRLINKTADDFSHDNPEIGEAVHHDVGVLYTVGEEKRRLAYSITSSADSGLGARNANRLNQLVATTLIEAVGGKPKSALGAVASKLLSK